MKIICGALILFFLIGMILTSCNGLASPPTINPTDVMETSMSMVRTEVVATLTAAPTSTPTFSPVTPSLIPPTQTPSYDRHDPEVVLRAWFDALEQKDAEMMDLLHGTNTHGAYAFESTKSIEILEIQLISSSSAAERVYRVWFDIQYTDPLKKSGKTQLTFYLTWDANRDAWIITNYGYS